MRIDGRGLEVSELCVVSCDDTLVQTSMQLAPDVDEV